MNEFQRPMRPWPGLETLGRMVRLPRAGLSVFVFEAGEPSAPAMLMIHGLGDEGDTWRHALLPLARAHRVAALDLPGFGRSDKPRRAYTLPFLRDVIAELLDVLGWTRAALVGHSLGAAISQMVALAQPTRITQLWLVSGSLTTRAQKLNPVVLQMALPFFGARLYNGLRGHPQAAYDSLRPYYANLDALPEAERKFLYQRVNERVWSDGQRDAFLSIVRYLAWSAPGQQRALEKQLAQLTVPTHALWGELDAMNSVESGRALAAIQPSARLTVFPGVGHNLHQDAPEKFLSVLQSQ